MDHFTCPLLDALNPLERIHTGLADRRRYIGSDATGEDVVRDRGRPSVMAITDFTAATWFAVATSAFYVPLRRKCGKFADDLIVYIAELLPVVALACQRKGAWTGEIIVAVIDNDNARHAINSRKSKNRYARYLLRILTLLEVKYKFRVVAYYVNTHHNVLNDTISRVFDTTITRATAIADTQVVIDTMVTGLRWEELDDMLGFLTADQTAMVTFALPCDSERAPAAGLLTPFGARWRSIGAAPTAPPAMRELPMGFGGGTGSVFEHCGGLLQLSRALVAGGACWGGYTETCPFTTAAMAVTAPAAVCYGDFFDQVWRGSSGPQRPVRWLVSGPPCTPFSGAGKQLGALDRRSKLLFALADMASFFKPEFVIIEEVPRFADSDEGACLAALDTDMDKAGYVREKEVEVICPAVTLRASAQRRPRMILHFERKDVRVALGGACARIAAVPRPPARVA